MFPGIVEQVPGKGKGVIATRDIKNDEIIVIYPGRLVTQAYNQPVQKLPIHLQFSGW